MLSTGSPTEYLNISMNMPAIDEEAEIQPERPPLSPEVRLETSNNVCVSNFIIQCDSPPTFMHMQCLISMYIEDITRQYNKI